MGVPLEDRPVICRVSAPHQMQSTAGRRIECEMNAIAKNSEEAAVLEHELCPDECVAHYAAPCRGEPIEESFKRYLDAQCTLVGDAVLQRVEELPNFLLLREW